MSKRIFDVVGASIGMLLLLPVYLLIAAAIKVSDRGPIFCGQVRVG